MKRRACSLCPTLPVLAFEHKGWQSKQCEFFADVFTEAIENGLPAIQTQHPGLYYQQVRLYTVRIAHKLFSTPACIHMYSGGPVRPVPSRDRGGAVRRFGREPLPQPGPFGGLRGDGVLWAASLAPGQGLAGAARHGAGDGWDTDAAKRAEGEGGEVIVGLLQAAIAQFRKFRSPRSESHLTVNMAEELKTAQRYR